MYRPLAQAPNSPPATRRELFGACATPRIRIVLEPRPQPHAYPRPPLPVESEADVDAGFLTHIHAEMGRRALH